MSINLTPDTYTPSIDNNGNYIDNISVIKHGLYCPCGTRKDKIYNNMNNFSTHIKSKTHQKWLLILNQNKANYYVEMIKNKEIIENQKKIIAQLEIKLQTKILAIDYLTVQLIQKENKKDLKID